MKKEIKEIVRATFNIYGIKNDPIAFRLIETLDFNQLDYIFFDLRDFPPTDEQIAKWAEYLEEEYPINTKSTLFKKNEKRFLKLSLIERLDWLRLHYHVIERPIVEDKEGQVITIGGRPETIVKLLLNHF
jgi:arsenate reductase-like glutaredoxin family protein